MRTWKALLGTWALLCAAGCGHGEAARREEPGSGLRVECARGDEGACGAEESKEETRSKGGTVSARIWTLIAQGQFAEAQALIAESAAAGLISQQVAAKMLERITLLNTRLGQVPATLQRVADFPSQLRDLTLFQIKQLLERRDFTLATQAQLKLAEKLIEQQERLMEKVQ
ncbi:hypothetical protein [Archangium lansingense]|uniref:Lipoprotein n=1 Tax=Archangium lansingense TaxID=2995310 RepID=A0ABT4AM84_9BACT|nr:hypothetical protein [Archangium lansinium]MCY1082765.1 hypothetical protein [Archangium lansinium]